MADRTTRERLVLVVDDHEGMRSLLCAVFELEMPDVKIVEAHSAREAISQWLAHRPDVVVLDQMLGTKLGLEDVAVPILSDRPDQRIVVFTAFLHDELRQRASALGIDDVLSQDDLRRLPSIVARLLAD